MKKNRATKTRKSRDARFDFQTLEPRKLMATLSGNEPLQADQFALPALIQNATQTQDQDHGPAQRIVNGEQTDGWEAVGYVGPLGCTGTLISPTHVLTAAHCLENVGDRAATFEVNGQTYKSTKVTIHENYNPNRFDVGYDLAVIELARPVVGIEPMEIYRNAPQVGSMLTLVGFGEGGTSQGGYDPDDDGKQVGQTELEEVTQQHISWNFDSHNEANTAPGDSGGPAFVEVDGKFYIAGVTSGGDGDAHSLGDYSFDTRIDVHADWIDDKVGSDGPGDPGEDDHTDEPNSDATRIALVNGKGSAAGKLEAIGDRDAFKFTLSQSGETTISLDATGGSNVNTYLRIYNTDGELIHEDNNSGPGRNAKVIASLPAGRYFATAGANNDNGTGNYKININHVEDSGGNDYDRFTNNTPKEISEFGRDRVVSALDVSGLRGEIADLNVEVNIQHTYDSDLRLVLIAPDRTRIVMVNRQGGSQNNFTGTTFDQQANRHINHGDAPFRGSYRPAMSLNRFNGMNPNGRWRLVVIDFEDFDGGSLDNWTLEIDTDSSRNKRAELATNHGKPTAGNASSALEVDQNRRRRFHSRNQGLSPLAASIQSGANDSAFQEVDHSNHQEGRTTVVDEVFASSAFDGLFG